MAVSSVWFGVFCLLLSPVSLSGTVIKASLPRTSRDVPFKLTGSSSPDEQNSGDLLAFKSRVRRTAPDPGCAQTNATNKPEYKIVNLKHDERLEDHDSLKPIWVDDSVVIVTEDKLNGSHLIRVYEDSDGNIHSESRTSDIGGQRVTAATVSLSPADKRTVFVISDDQTKLFVSLDGGKTWSGYRLPVSAFNVHYDVLYHPTDASYILVVGRDRVIWLSRNFGRTWSSVVSSVVKADWDANYESKTVNYVYYMKLDGTRDRYSHTLYRNSIAFDQEKELDKHVYSFVVDGRFVFLSKQNKSDLTNMTRRMYSSTQAGENFHQSHLPSVRPEGAYVVIHTHEAGTFIHVRDPPQSPSWFTCGNNGSLYTSDISAAFFSLSLTKHFYMSCFLTYHDFVEVQSTSGVYLTSRVVENGLDTYISSDNGAYWERLHFVGTPPSGACPSGNCALNLHMLASMYGHAGANVATQAPLHLSSAPGLIIALGMFGSIPYHFGALNTSLTLSHTYVVISSDGGQTWRIPQGLSDPGNYYFTILDYGNAILIAEGRKPSPRMWISHDRGGSFRCILIDSTDFIIHGFVPVLNPSDRKAAVIGQNVPSKGTFAYWKVAIVDVAHYLERPCLKDDYSTTLLQKNCILGQQELFNITKPSSICYNTESYSPKPVQAKPCNCSIKYDFECAYGWVKKESGSCSKMTLNSSLDRSELCRPGETQYTDTQGYIRVPGDTCTDQENKLKSLTKPCKGYEKEAGFGWKDVSHFLTKTSGGVAVLAIFCVLVVLIIGFLVVCFARKWRSKSLSQEPVKYTRVPLTDESDREDKGEVEDDKFLEP